MLVLYIFARWGNWGSGRYNKVEETSEVMVGFKPISSWWQRSFSFHCLTLATLTGKGCFNKGSVNNGSDQKLTELGIAPMCRAGLLTCTEGLPHRELPLLTFSSVPEYFISNAIALGRYTKPTLHFPWLWRTKGASSPRHCNLQLLWNTFQPLGPSSFSHQAFDESKTKGSEFQHPWFFFFTALSMGEIGRA